MLRNLGYTKYFYNPIDNIYANPKINYLSI